MRSFHDEALWKSLPRLFRFFSKSNPLEENIMMMGKIVSMLMPVRAVALAEISSLNGNTWRRFFSWSEKFSQEATILQQRLEDQLPILVELVQNDPQISRLPVAESLGYDRETPLMLYVIRYDDLIQGLFLIMRENGNFDQDELKTLDFLSGITGCVFAAQGNSSNQQLSNFICNTVLDTLHISIYITDPQTDKILFMNQSMKKAFGIDVPEGKVCWKILQKDAKSRCEFCPISTLKQTFPVGRIFEWEEKNTVTGRFYRNYDSLIHWIDGRLVHLQQSIDITELKSANTDELTTFLTRRPGKQALTKALDLARNQGETVTVCMYDINHLKEVNDRFGHAQGDKLILTTANAVRGNLREQEYAFRLSGDEFVILFHTGQRAAKERIEQVMSTLCSGSQTEDMVFCYGLVEIMPHHKMTLEEALFLADERMYEQKRRYHIQRNQQKKTFAPEGYHSQPFNYDERSLYDALAQSTDDYIYVCNMKTGIFRYSQAMVDEFGLPSQIIANAATVWGEKVHPDDRPAFLESNQEITDGRVDSHCVEYRAKNCRNEWIWVRCCGHVVRNEVGEAVLFAGFISNLRNKNKVDSLTGLYNKLEFQDHISNMIEESSQVPFGVMILGIDNLKHINDLYDRTFGDEVIRITSQRIRRLLPSDAFVYRLDGDEFGVVAKMADQKSLLNFYQILSHIFENQQEHEGKKYYCTLSAGCLFYPACADNYLDLMKYAGYALDYAKMHGKKQCIFFSKEILGQRFRALRMVEALRESVENLCEGFSLCFQPLVHTNSGELMGVEALARWKHPAFGLVSPMEFIPLLEQTGLIVPVGKWVFQTALHTCAKWLTQYPNLVVDINLSYFQLEGDDFTLFMRNTLKQEMYPAENIVVELTESSFAKENERIQEIFKQIREMGVRIAIDDFGTGYSALGILKDSPVDLVKIDKTFVRDIQTSDFDATFIRFIVALCHDVGIYVCLEGVENQNEYQLVRQMGLDYIQGYYFGRPLTDEEFSDRYFSYTN